MQSKEDGRIPDEVWFIIKETMGVGDFIGTEGVPTPMRDTDVAKMLREAEKPEDTPNIRVEFNKGDVVKIREGAFENFEGIVDSIDAERGVVRVIVTIFGRSTPLDIEYCRLKKYKSDKVVIIMAKERTKVIKLQAPGGKSHTCAANWSCTGSAWCLISVSLSHSLMSEPKNLTVLSYRLRYRFTPTAVLIYY